MQLRHLRYIAFHVLAFILPALGVGILYTLTAIQDVMVPVKPEPPVFPVGSEAKFVKTWTPGKLRAVILIGHVGTGVTNALVAADTLAQTGRFDVATLSPKKLAVPLTGGVGLWPHFSAEDFGSESLKSFDLLVVPALLDSQNGLLQNLIREAHRRARVTLLLGEGVFAAAETGILGSRKSTSPRIGFEEVRATYPQFLWIDPSPVVVDGSLVSGAGLLHSQTATLEAARLLDPKISSRLGEASSSPAALPDHVPSGPTSRDYGQFFLRAAYDWGRTNIRVDLTSGVRDAALAAILDTWPRLLSARTVTSARTREPVPTAAGLWLLPTLSLDQAPPMDLVLTPASTGSSPQLYWDQLQAGSSIANCGTLEAVARILGAEWDRKTLTCEEDSRSLLILLIRPLLIGILGIAIARFLRKYVAFRNSPPRSPLPKSPNPS